MRESVVWSHDKVIQSGDVQLCEFTQSIDGVFLSCVSSVSMNTPFNLPRSFTNITSSSSSIFKS